jgi:hypothetical protein
MVDGMEDSMPTLEELIGIVADISPGSGPLQQLTDAVIVSGRITDLADDLVGHFVEIARESGATWASIGECMGVSKQAVQKRFKGGPIRRSGPPSFFASRLAEHTRTVVLRAASHAMELGNPKVDAAHLVLAMIDDPDCRASRAIVAAGVSLDAVRDAVTPARSEEAPKRRIGHTPFSNAAKLVLELALREAIRERGTRRIDSGHVLLGILREGRSPAGRALTGLGMDYRSVASWLAEH